MTNIGSHGKIQNRIEALGKGEPEFLFIIHFLIPGPPLYSVVLYFVPNNPDDLFCGSNYAKLCADFFDNTDDAKRDERLKVIPSVIKGPWMIQQGVGVSPVILGHKIQQQYHRGPGYFEVDCDIGSSSVGTGIVRLLTSHSQSLVIDIAFVLEGRTEEELPEKVLASARIDRVNLESAPTL